MSETPPFYTNMAESCDVTEEALNLYRISYWKQNQIVIVINFSNANDNKCMSSLMQNYKFRLVG